MCFLLHYSIWKKPELHTRALWSKTPRPQTSFSLQSVGVRLLSLLPASLCSVTARRPRHLVPRLKRLRLDAFFRHAELNGPMFSGTRSSLSAGKPDYAATHVRGGFVISVLMLRAETNIMSNTHTRTHTASDRQTVQYNQRDRNSPWWLLRWPHLWVHGGHVSNKHTRHEPRGFHTCHVTWDKRRQTESEQFSAARLDVRPRPSQSGSLISESVISCAVWPLSSYDALLCHCSWDGLQGSQCWGEEQAGPGWVWWTQVNAARKGPQLAMFGARRCWWR